MAVRSGRFRHRISLVKPKLDSSGEPERNEFGELTGETQVVQKPWCNVRDVKSDEAVSTSSIAGQSVVIFELRYTKELENPDTNMFIIFRDAEYDITSVVDPHYMRERLNVTATRRR